MTEEMICVYCQRGHRTIPLLSLMSDGEQKWICPEDLPKLIHQPSLLQGSLKGVENLDPGDHD